VTQQEVEPVQCGCPLGVLDGGAHWRNLANTTEPYMCGIAMRPYDSYFDQLLLLLLLTMLILWCYLIKYYKELYGIVRCCGQNAVDVSA